MNPVDLSLMFVLGLAGSLHCVQMCGPLVLSFGIPLAGQPRRRQAAAHLAYHAGRLLTYSALGALAGWLGSGMTWMGRLAGIENIAALVGGVFMVLAALLMTGVVRASSLVSIGPSSRLTRLAGRMLHSPSIGGKLGMGMALGFLPCGLIYAALLKSVAAASTAAGAAGMALFALGTAGPLFGVGVFSAAIGRLLGGRTTRWAALFVAAMGVILIWRGILPVTSGPAGHHH